MKNPKDSNILLYLPMTKAAVKAMDAVTEFSANLGVKIENFMIGGASKVSH